MDEFDEEFEETTNQVLDVLRRMGLWRRKSKFIWFRELKELQILTKDC